MSHLARNAKATLTVTVRIEVTEDAPVKMGKHWHYASIDKGSRAVYNSNANSIGGSLSGEVGGTVATPEPPLSASAKASATGKLNVAWSHVHSLATTKDEERELDSDTHETFNPDTTRILAKKTITFSLLSKSGKVVEHKQLGIGNPHHPLEPGSNRKTNYEKEAWTTWLGVTDVPTTKQIVFTIKDLPMERYSWVPLENGKQIPENAVYAGTYDNDGPVYVGKFEDQPGKINTHGNTTMCHCWVDQEGQKKSDSGEILTTDFHPHWENYYNGMLLPWNAVSGEDTPLKDNEGDWLYVGKANNDEPGKLTAGNGKLNHLWCPAQGKQDSGKVLIIDSWEH